MFRSDKHEEVTGQPMTAAEAKVERALFKLMDSDGSGEIEWREFVYHEACRKLTVMPRVRSVEGDVSGVCKGGS